MARLPGWLPDFPADPIDAVVQEGLEGIFPAASILVIYEGEIVFRRAYGFLDAETRSRLAQTDTLFDLASLTKLFTATAFMRLVEAGLVRLDQPVGEVIAEFSGVRRVGATEDPLLKTMIPADPRYAGLQVHLEEVTFRRLLTHTAGLAAWRSVYQESPLPGEIHQPEATPEHVRKLRIARVSEYDFACPPGRRVIYSDLGFILLGEAIERLTGLNLATYIEREVCKPLGMRRTCFNPLKEGFSVSEIAPSEVCAWRKRWLVGEVDDENTAGLGGVAGHAGLFSTGEDLARLARLYRDRGIYPGGQYLRASTVAEMIRQQVDLDCQRRGLAWALWTREDCSCGTRFGKNSYGHTGFTGTSLWIDPDRDLIAIALTNRVYHGRESNAIQDFRPKFHDHVIEAVERWKR